MHRSKVLTAYCSWRIKLTHDEWKEAKKGKLPLPSTDGAELQGSQFEGWTLACTNFGDTCPICRNCPRHCVGHVGLMNHCDPNTPTMPVAIAEGLDRTRARLRQDGWDFPLTPEARHSEREKEQAA